MSEAKKSAGPTTAPTTSDPVAAPAVHTVPEAPVQEPEGPTKVECVMVEGQPMQLYFRGENLQRQKVVSFYNEHGLIIRHFDRDDHPSVMAVPTREPHPVTKKIAEVPS